MPKNRTQARVLSLCDMVPAHKPQNSTQAQVLNLCDMVLWSKTWHEFSHIDDEFRHIEWDIKSDKTEIKDLPDL